MRGRRPLSRYCGLPPHCFFNFKKHVRKCGYAKALIYTSLTHFCFVCMFKNITATFPAATFSKMPTCHKGGQHFSQPFSQRSVCLSVSPHVAHGGDARHAQSTVVRCSEMQCGAVRCSEMQWDVVRCSGM